jgi:hypothetical protein
VTLVIPGAIKFEKIVALLVGGLVFTMAVWATRPYPVGVFHDDGVYITLAKSLATGEGYRYLNLPGTPVATHYPPGYPLLLAALWKIAPEFPRNIPVLQLVNAVALALTAVGTMVFSRRILGWNLPASMAGAVIGTVSYPLLGLSVYLLSEPLFAALLLPSLVLAERVTRDGSGARDALLVGVVAAVLTLVRTHGIALIAAAVLVLALRTRWRQAAIVAASAAIVLAPWQLYVAAHDAAIVGPLRGKYASYATWLLEGWRIGIGFMGATIGANVKEIGELFADRFSLSDRAIPRLATAVIAAIFAMAGAVRLSRRAPVTAVFVALYMVILLVWPYTPWRFFYALWPIVILCLGETLRWLAEVRSSATAPATAGLLLATGLALGGVRAETRAYHQQSWHHPGQRAASGAGPLILWVQANTRPGDVVAVESEQLVYLFTGRLALPPQAFTAAEYVRPRQIAATTQSLRSVLSEFPVNYLVTGDPHVLQAARVLSDSASSLRLRARLVPMEGPRYGGAFRVERPDQRTTNP